jgi:hypothetical protein
VQRLEHRRDVGVRGARLVGDCVQRALQAFGTAELLDRFRQRRLLAESFDAGADHFRRGIEQRGIALVVGRRLDQHHLAVRQRNAQASSRVRGHRIRAVHWAAVDARSR